jgi:hypothetical protein
VTVTVSALSGVLRAQGVGELPVLIQPNPVWLDPEGDREASAAMWTEFAEVDLLDRRGRLDGDVLDTLHVLARPSVEHAAVFTADERQDSVVLATQGEETVVAYREGEAVTLTSLRHPSLPETLLRQLPDARPAPIGNVNVRVADDTSDREQARTLNALAKARLVGQGELYVGVRDHYGRHRISAPIRYHDYKIGRVVVVTGGGYLSVAPASKKLLLARLLDAHRALVDG